MPLFSVGAKINKMLPDDKTVFCLVSSEVKIQVKGLVWEMD